MYLADVRRATGDDGVFHLYVIGDLHADKLEFDEARLKAYVQHIVKDKLAVALFVGDALDGRIPGRKHFEIDGIRPDFRENLRQYAGYGLQVVANYLKPLVKAKVPLVVISGNHDEYLEESSFSVDLVKMLGGETTKYLGGEGFVRIKTGRGNTDKTSRVTVVYGTHGSGGGKHPGSKVNAMQRQYEWLDADIVVAGHVHDGHIRVLTSYGIGRDGPLQLRTSPRAMVRAPSFVRRAVEGYVGYQGKKGYPSSDDGLQYLRVNPKERRMYRRELEL